MERSKLTTTIVIVLLVIFYEIGVLGLHMEETSAIFQQLIPFNLLLSFVVLGWFHKQWTLAFGIFLFVVFWATYLIEVIGVSTGWIFGDYYYGNALGFKLAGVPPLIGINWLILTYITGIMSQKLTYNLWLRSLFGALLMVLLDLFIEPVAVQHDFWIWQNGHIPFQNFFAWFIISFGVQYGFHSLNQEKANPIAYPLYLIQVIFFATSIVIDGWM